ncbi:MAG: tRNA uridine-5-carboxymethylaminomethyl(34) synthesis GTPase MnmE [Clostridia bacterium]|nr:tRNA uridine-5-carboxymethylaminomethyl(34) synthesis GTPase MnmE [Clostridia bacterium]
MSTIAAIATPNASGGIGVIRISGEEAVSVADSVFRSVSGKALSSLKGYSALFGHVYDGDMLIDECVALVFRGPKSYTGEDVVEISCHGGLYVTQRVLRTVFNAGAVPAEAGEFTKRAFLNGKIDLAEAESVMNVISAHGQQALDAALNTLDGKLSGQIKNVAAALTNVSAGIAVWTDAPDEDVPVAHEENVREVVTEALGKLDELISRFDSGRAVTEGVSAAICGHPNVGKSTLMNQLTGFDRSIVTPVAGTTRDVVEETVRLGDIVLRLADTAGIHESDDIVESIGIDRSMQKLRTSQLVLAVFDGSQELEEDDMNLLSECRNRRAVAVINKTDLEMKTDPEKIKEYIDDVVYLSAMNGDGIAQLQTVLEKLLGTAELDTSSGMLSSERQYSCCRSAAESLREAVDGIDMGVTLDAVNVSIDYAIEKLLELTGEKAREAVVNEVFSKFCVGK